MSTNYKTVSATEFQQSDGWTDATECYNYLTAWDVEVPYKPDAVGNSAYAFHGQFAAGDFIARVDAEVASITLNQKAQSAWTDWLEAEVETPAIGTVFDYGKVKKTNNKVVGEGVALSITNPQAIQFVVEQLANHKQSLIDRRLAELKPKPQALGKSGGKRVRRKATEYTWNFSNTEATAHGMENKYYLEGDADATTIKGQGKIIEGADGTLTKNGAYKSLRRSKPFIGGESCCRGWVQWDLAGGSEALKGAGCQGSIKIGCGAEPTEGDFCKGCAEKDRNLFSEQLKSGKTYAQVLWELGSVNGVADTCTLEWVQHEVERCGKKWIE